MKITCKADTVKLLNLLEEAHYADFKKVNGVNPWPLIKIQIGYFLDTLTLGIQKESGDREVLEPKTFPPFQIKHSIRLVKALIKLAVLAVKLFKKFDQVILLIGYKKAHSINLRGNSYNIYLHPFANIANELGVNTKLLYVDEREDVEDPVNVTEHTFLRYLKYVSGILPFISKNDNINAYKNAQLVKDFLLTSGIEHYEKIAQKVYHIQIGYRSKTAKYYWLFKVTKPSMIWTYCYYDPEMMAVYHAANKLGIKSLEYQHSKQADDHYAYAKWRKIDDYSAFFPTDYWLWNISDAERIKRNFEGHSYKPKCIAGGNMHLILEKGKLKSNKISSGILICLQGFWIPEFIEQTIISDNKYKWYIRLHPRYPTDQPKLEALEKLCGSKIEVMEANSLSIYELLNMVEYHITCFSGAALEAQAFDVQNIIFGENGFNAYKSQIVNNDFSFVANKNEFDEILYSNRTKKIGRILVPDVETLKVSVASLIDA